MSNNTKRFWGTRFAAAVLLLVGLGAANAAVIRGNADPQFTGVGFLSGVYWSSTITFTVPDPCIAGTGAFTASATCTVTIGSITAALAASQGGTPTATPIFTAPGPFTSGVTIHHTAGVVDGFNFPVLGASAIFTDTNPAFTGFAWIDWGYTDVGGPVIPTAQFFIQQCTSNTNNYVKHYNTVCTPGLGNAAGSTIPATITITQIPEPGAPLLLFTALSVLWFVRRSAAMRR